MIFRSIVPAVWVSAESTGPLLMVSYFPKSKGWYEFYAAEYRMKSRRVTSQVIFMRELFQTTVFTLTPDMLLRDIVTRLATVNDVTNPVELAYSFGGTVRGEPIRIFNANTLH